MKRREKDIWGVVNFPVDSSKYTNSKEGGLAVKLVVLPPSEFNNDVQLCGGAEVYDYLTENLIGCDKIPKPKWNNKEFFTPEDIEAHDQAINQWTSMHYPRFNKENYSNQYVSTQYLATLLIGSTGWTGWDNEKEEYWHCQYEDLDDFGKHLYMHFNQLYPDCEIQLLTFLDT